MSKQLHTATEKSTGRAWYYLEKWAGGRHWFATPYAPRAWFKTLAEVKAFGKQTGQFRYNDEPALGL